MFITISGMDALSVAQGANLLPEVLAGSLWRSAKSLVEARALVATDPASVRLKGDPRILLENILKVSIDRTQSLPAVMVTALSNGLGADSIPVLQRYVS